MIFPNYPFQVILSSGSPRRVELLKNSNINFTTIPLDFAESYPSNIPNKGIAEYIAHQKALFAVEKLKPTNEQVIITADCLVFLNNKPLGKPKTEQEAIYMLESLSGGEHSVISGICLLNNNFCIVDSCITNVTLVNLSSKMIEYYVKEFNPMDKAGAYGIQEWFGHIGIEKINGSYTNVMGLPMHLVFRHLENIAKFYF